MTGPDLIVVGSMTMLLGVVVGFTLAVLLYAMWTNPNAR